MISRSTRIRNSKGFKRWLPCRAWDFESLMYPSVLCSKLFGLFPYKYQNEEYAVTKTRLAFTAFSACFHSALLTYVLYTVNFSNRNDKILQTMSVNFYVLLEGSLPILMILTTYSRSFMLRRLSKVSRILSPRDFNDMAKFLHLAHILNVLYHITHIPLFYINKRHYPLSQRYINLFLAITSSEGVLFYVNCVYILEACIKKVNENLKRLRKCSTDDQSELIEEHLSRRQAVMLLMQVKHNENVHEEFSDAFEFLNETSCSISISFTAATFVLVTLDLYMLMFQIDNTGAMSINTYFQYEYFSYMCLRLTKFVVLVWVCETAAGHAMEINTTIYDLANKCTDDTVKRELRYFALQVMNRDNAVNTRAFKMNGKLLSQVLNGILMYIMILFQFLMSSNCTN